MNADPEYCRHYRAMAHYDTCEIGVNMMDKRSGDKPYRFPCHNPAARNLCELAEEYTPEEIEARQRVVRERVEQLKALIAGESRTCVHCGQEITSMRQVGRSVYGSCGCRLWQGTVPKVWTKTRT